MSIASYTKISPAIYEGKTSHFYKVEEDPETLIMEHKDDITARNGEKHDIIPGIGAIRNKISCILYRQIDSRSIAVFTHLFEPNNDHYRFGMINERETAVEKNEPTKLEVVVRNIAAGSILKRLPFKDGQKFDDPIIELHYKDAAWGYPIMSASEAIALGIIDIDAHMEIENFALEANEILQNLFAQCGTTLVDMKLEFGREGNGYINIINHLSPDNCRLWDTETGRKLDKDIYREGGSLEDVLAAYQEVLDRLKACVSEDDEDEEKTDEPGGVR